MDTYADGMDMSQEPWDSPEQETTGERDSWDDPKEEGPKVEDPWDDPKEEGPKGEDPWDDPKDEGPKVEDPWDDPEEEKSPKQKEKAEEGEETEGGKETEDPPQVERLKAQVERLEQEAKETNTLAALLEQSARRMGLTPEGYLTHLRQRELMELGLSADGAALQAKIEQKAAMETVSAKRKAATQQRQQEEMRRFVSEFPQVKPEEIPKEVWSAARRGESLTEAYLRAENKRLTLELEAAQTQKKNQARALGSRRDAGGDSGRDSFLMGFFSD